MSTRKLKREWLRMAEREGLRVLRIRPSGHGEAARVRNPHGLECTVNLLCSPGDRRAMCAARSWCRRFARARSREEWTA